ncbi:MATE family efflux transporter [Ruminococcus sp. OA3]|uniref:MATE family efflux transporter n=1 Tax=Ruminococcus sp. OA3 TaxID=2914164 RepID=UPI001F05CDFC|nr:MATE family efflux transporter [Ruminococcus sp. OA3]MCH1984205.1 MATE family efflux transporter [Ruminococcus sp. OA3]
MEQSYMKERSVLPLLLSMSVPMVISMLVNSLYNIVDSIFVAKISENAMTALSLVFPVQNLINSIAVGFGVGISAVIAICLGAQKQRQADTAASQGMLFAILHGMILTGAWLFGIQHFLKMFTEDADIIQEGWKYSSIVISFSVVIMAGITFEKIFQSVGKMKITMIGMICGCVVNIILDPIMIFGLGPVPALGIRGAAWATGIGQTVTLAIYVAVYAAKPLNVKLRLKNLKWDRAVCTRLYTVGIPAAMNMALPSLLISALNGILAAYSQTYVVVLGVYYKLQTFLYMPANGIVQGMRPLIGYNYGAEEKQRVKKIYRIALTLIAVIMGVGMLVCLALPDYLMGMFTENPQTVEAGTLALRTISAGFLVSAVSVTSAGALEGIGKGVPSLMISLLRYVIIIIPAAFLLSRISGAAGVWHAFWIAEAVTALAAYMIYRRASGQTSDHS